MMVGAVRLCRGGVRKPSSVLLAASDFSGDKGASKRLASSATLGLKGAAANRTEAVVVVVVGDANLLGDVCVAACCKPIPACLSSFSYCRAKND